MAEREVSAAEADVLRVTEAEPGGTVAAADGESATRFGGVVAAPARLPGVVGAGPLPLMPMVAFFPTVLVSGAAVGMRGATFVPGSAGAVITTTGPVPPGLAVATVGAGNAPSVVAESPVAPE